MHIHFSLFNEKLNFYLYSFCVRTFFRFFFCFYYVNSENTIATFWTISCFLKQNIQRNAIFFSYVYTFVFIYINLQMLCPICFENLFVAWLHFRSREAIAIIRFFVIHHDNDVVPNVILVSSKKDNKLLRKIRKKRFQHHQNLTISTFKEHWSFQGSHFQIRIQTH